MIVTQTYVVNQPAHAAMSAQIAQAWLEPEVFAGPLWKAIVTATAVHDDGWKRTERDLSEPVDFKDIDSAEHAAIWRRSVSLAEQHGNLPAMLVALHARWLYTHHNRADVGDKAVEQDLVNDLTHRIAAGMEGLPSAVSPAMLNDAQQLLAFFDGLSLALIGGIEPFASWPDAIFGSWRQTLNLGWTDEGVTITPWPFTYDVVELSVETTDGELAWTIEHTEV